MGEDAYGKLEEAFAYGPETALIGTANSPISLIPRPDEIHGISFGSVFPYMPSSEMPHPSTAAVRASSFRSSTRPKPPSRSFPRGSISFGIAEEGFLAPWCIMWYFVNIACCGRRPRV